LQLRPALHDAAKTARYRDRHRYTLQAVFCRGCRSADRTGRVAPGSVGPGSRAGMNGETRRGRREGAMFVAQWKEYRFPSVEACLQRQEQDYAGEMRTVERHKALQKRRWQRALLREQERYLNGLIEGARAMAARLERGDTAATSLFATHRCDSARVSQSRPEPECVTKFSVTHTFTLIRKGSEMQNALVLDFQREFRAFSARVQSVFSASSEDGLLTFATLLKSSAIWWPDNGAGERRQRWLKAEGTCGCRVNLMLVAPFPSSSRVVPGSFPCCSRIVPVFICYLFLGE